MRAPASFSRVVMVGTIPLRSILWIAAAETSARSAELLQREALALAGASRSFGPDRLTIWPRSSRFAGAASSACAPVHALPVALANGAGLLDAPGVATPA